MSALPEALRHAIRRLSWRALGVTLALTFAVDLYFVFQWAADPLSIDFSAANVNVLIGLGIMFATLVADEFVAKGARRLPAYLLAVGLGAGVGLLMQYWIKQWLLPLGAQDFSGLSGDAAARVNATVVFEYLVWGSIAVFIYVNRRSALLAGARLNLAQLQRADAQRHSLETRLQALQARIEPQFLFDSLAQVRDLYETDPAKGGRVLGDLISYLRAALPHLRDATSTIRRELDLVVAYLEVMRARFDERLEFTVEVSDVPGTVRMPAMVLLPLISYALGPGSAPIGIHSIRIDARRAGDRLRVEIDHSGNGFDAASDRCDLRDVEQRLHGLYDRAWTLDYGPSGDRGTRALIEIPYEAGDDRHR